MSVNGLNTAVSGIQTNQFRLDTTANNIANVNTDGFQARTVQTTDRAYINDIGTGTQVSATYQPYRPGPPAQRTDAMGVPNEGGVAAGNGAAAARPVETAADMVEQSNTDLVTEMTNMNAARTAYSANIAVARTVDEMNQTLMDINA